MEPKARYVLVGIFVLSLFLGLLMTVVWLKHYPFQGRGPVYAIYFKGSVAGLRENEVVTYNGVPIGNVKKIDIDPKRLDAIRVLVRIRQPQLIRTTSKASLEAKGISGNLFIRIHPGHPEDAVLSLGPDQDYPIIPSEYSDFQKLLNDAPKIVQSFVDLTDKIAPFFAQENSENFKKLLGNLAEFTTTFNKNTKEGLYEFNQLMREMRELSANCNRILKKFEDNPRNFLLQSSREDGYVIAP